jgi:hypothetical protein
MEPFMFHEFHLSESITKILWSRICNHKLVGTTVSLQECHKKCDDCHDERHFEDDILYGWKKRASLGTAGVLLERLELGASARAVKASLKIGMRSAFI